MFDLLVLKLLLERENYRAHRNALFVSKELQPVLEGIDQWYKNNTTNPSVEEIAILVYEKQPRNLEYLSQALERLRIVDLPKDVTTLLRTQKNALTASALALEAFKLSEGSGSLDRVINLTKELEKPQEAQISFVEGSLQDLIRDTIQKPGLRWRLPWLNHSLGSLRTGDFGFIFARPETGKTTLLASEVTFMAEQGAKVLWFNNEEQGKKVKLRSYQAVLGATLQQIQKQPERAEKVYREKVGERILIYDSAVITAKTVERVVEQEQPGLIIFDQIDKIKGFDNDREDLHLGAIYIWARELAKAYAPVLGVCQASGEAEGVEWLTMAHVANAKTSKQAEADFILGIGKSPSYGMENVRFLNISKNKLIGDPDTNPALRHGRTEVLIRADMARYEMT